MAYNHLNQISFWNKWLKICKLFLPWMIRENCNRAGWRYINIYLELRCNITKKYLNAQQKINEAGNILLILYENQTEKTNYLRIQKNISINLKIQCIYISFREISECFVEDLENISRFVYSSVFLWLECSLSDIYPICFIFI